MDRKTFIQKSIAGMLIALPAYMLVGCSSGSDNDPSPNPNPDPDPTPSGNCIDNGTNSTISANHGHTLTVSKEDVQAGAQKSYSIQGSSSHNHTVTLTAANFSSLQSNNSITVGSTNDDGHTHSVTVSCA
ncbi:hypothetical protein [Tenacibaculum caenipelagi]|uniref:Uncharacterized protein n=1 Tax=Tenacibaculum caenipelagi TaxID=1325435 RepID=A0A4R6TCP8_9FLAO|nr:hypothetical protein [Tenacibaculum caenipelagi]TDQ25564.1 hypothetical protein DFQ07_1989 [Tenacibaculum caenipelagi]